MSILMRDEAPVQTGSDLVRDGKHAEARFEVLGVANHEIRLLFGRIARKGHEESVVLLLSPFPSRSAVSRHEARFEEVEALRNIHTRKDLPCLQAIL